MKKLVLLLVIVVLAMPLAAGAHSSKHDNDHHISFSGHSGFDIEDGELTLTNRTRHGKDRVVITEDGDLTINGDRIKTDNRERKMLRKFYDEAAELEEMAEEIAQDAGKIAKVSTKFATQQVAAALRSLSDDDDDDFDEEKMEAIEADFEREMETIEEFAGEIEDQADKLEEMADDLKEAIPELDDLGWFLDD